MTEAPAKILVVDDVPTNIALLDAVLSPRGYVVVSAKDGNEALEVVAREKPDLVLLDVHMPGMDGYQVCRHLRSDPETQFLPVVMVTATAEQEKVKAIEAGAEDFIPKPFDKAELLARVKSLLRIKSYHDTIERQATELLELNRTLEARVAEQVQELARLTRLRRFLSPQVADLILSSGDESILESHRSEIAVLFCDLRGFTAFATRVEPDEVMSVLNEFHAAVGELVRRFDATVGWFAGDGLMVFFNDPVPRPEPAVPAVQMAAELRDSVAALGLEWHLRGYDLGLGIGIDVGDATLGQMGFEGRFDYSAIGNVVNLAARLCAEAKDGQILISERTHSSVQAFTDVEPVGELQLKGFANLIPVWDVTDLRESLTGQ
ncbi:MAG: response regulator [Actinobacteria bacterium]|nr:response regulator [Actinomycetota bacterium]